MSGSPGMSERERQVMKKLKEVVDKQRDEIRAKDRELTLKNEDIEAVSEHLSISVNTSVRQYGIVIEAHATCP